MRLFKDFADNLELNSCSKPIDKNFETQIIRIKNIEIFLRHLNFIIPYFCQHPHSILEEIEKLKEDGLDSIIKKLHKITESNIPVWHGTIGEAIATSYILSSTDYKIPVFKLRFATNRKMAMHGDDLLGMKFNIDGTPQELLVVEVKNYSSNLKEAVAKASEGLLKVQKSSTTLLDFIINVLQNAGKYQEAKQIKQFLDPYSHPHETKYLGFIVTQESKWKDQYFNAVVENIKPPLTINAFLIPNWIEHQKNLVHSQNKMPSKLSIPKVEINELEDVKKLLENVIFRNEHNQLASEALTVDLKNPQRSSTRYSYDPIKLEKAANFLGVTGYNLLADAPEEAEKVLKEAAVIHERLATLRLEDAQNASAIDNIITSALLYSLAGYNANAKVLVSKILRHQDIKDILLSDIPKILLAYLLNGEIIQIQDTLAQFFYKFAQRKLKEPEHLPEEEEWIDWVTEEISNIGDYLTAKAFAHFIQYLRTGDDLHQLEILKLTVAAGKQYATIGDYRSYVPELTASLQLDNIEPLKDWLLGKDYKELADLYFDGKTENVVKKLEKVTYAFAWGFNSLISHISFYLNKEKLPIIFKGLTSFVTHGVSTTTAVYAISLGVHDRQIAIKLSTAYQAIFPKTVYSNFKEWLFTLSFDQWKELVQVEDENIKQVEECFNDVQKKQRKLEKNLTVFDCLLCRINDYPKIDAEINKNDLIVVGFDENLYLTTYDYQNYWQLGGENVDKLKLFDRQIHDFIINNIDQQREVVSISVY